MESLSKQAGKLIYEVRKANGFTQKELGERLGIGESRVSRYESGKQNPTLATLEKISQVLKVEFVLTLKE